MNTNPDETKLALWLDDELSGSELFEMDAWAASRPDQLAAREELRSFRKMMSENVPAEEELPYPDFFLSRIHQGIREMEAGERKQAHQHIKKPLSGNPGSCQPQPAPA